MTESPEEVQRCTNCGALARTRSARFCEYCGTELPAPDPSATPAAAAPPGPDEVLATLEGLDELDAVLRTPPVFDVARTGTLLGAAAFLVIWCGACLFIAFVAGMVFPPVALLPLLFLVLGVVGVGARIRKEARFRRAPVHQLPAVIVKERTQVLGGGEDQNAQTRYYLTLQTRAGRDEHLVEGSLFGKLAPGDAGVAYLKGGRLVAFRRLTV